MEDNKIAISVLSDEYCKVGGKIFADYFLHNFANDEVKKSVEANDFLNGLMTGNLKKEWKLEDTDDFKKLVALAIAINKLRK